MPEQKTTPLIKPKLMIFLKICFYCNLVYLALSIITPIIYFSFKEITIFQVSVIFQAFQPFGYLSIIFFWIYCIYFYFKFDRYSAAGIKLFFLNILYTPFYFYKVIWKRKRELKNTIQHEPVIGNTIHLENYEDEEL